ncbi:MAG: HD-GYP domain-containing protein [Gammaproteobacteria bacterium]|nr:HD-GYP domain-containing protein [Gammaproteobacteria bacterium]
MKRKVEVSELDIGHYVAELDRPWVDSPFLFQGFKIESGEELDQIRELCKFVIVDEAKSDDGEDDKTIRLSVNARPDANPKQSRGEWQAIASQERKVSFEREFQKVYVTRKKTRQYVDKLLGDVRLGNAIDTDTAKAVVTEMVELISEDADAALWLTQLKNAHDYTAQHCINVCVLSIAFSSHLGFPREQIKLIGLGALLHDVGKMRTPKEVLDKPGKLTPEEFEIMKRHPVDGYEIMKETNAIPPQALQIIRYHHERISGKGYPDGLEGSQISTAVLVTAICDVYDAITSDRVYHHGIPADHGLNAMYQMAPSDFGRELVQEFIKCVGIYPVGSTVELANGAIGVVMTNDPRNKLRPVVMLVKDKSGDFYKPRRYVSLSAQAAMDAKTDWSVRRIVDPKSHDISMHRIANEEFIDGGSEVIHI